VTTERLKALLNGIGVEISKRQVVRLLAELLDDFVAEDQEVLRAGLATARWVTVDDTAARHARKDGFTTQVGDASEIACDLRGFTVFQTGTSKSREAFLALLRAGHTVYVVNNPLPGLVPALYVGLRPRCMIMVATRSPGANSTQPATSRA